ncbi:MAG TPA: hypothetical protein PK079_24495 [Leptospiraceae bacterium]|nr:hypothetical protein [Leptospiraceae bacterium]HMW07477.1 hypothetical protein [Leptospiraceae bacterium]HMX34914.1 hypothetical protein [Leptospiraceae bacterium]HMY33129.1 hypothetical protein [Leptospiraceae bacterium]HMZ64254.1 hypothetical protein [Leptospiraceae bacterium]
MLYDSDYEGFRTWWKRSKTPARGYFKSYRAVSPIGDVFVVDYNFHENLVRLSLEPASEKGRTYTATIKNGTIIRERDVFNATNTSLKKKFHPFKNVFSCIPDDDVLNSIGGVYDISKVSLGKKAHEEIPSDAGELEPYTQVSGESFYKRLLHRAKDSYADFKIRFLDDLYDSILGVSVCLAIYLHFFDYVVLGFSLAFMGVFFGGLDWILRNRTPFYLKVMSFLSFGGYYFYTGFTRF